METKFAELFAGRTDCYGSWEGGCIKEPVTPMTYTKHLWGQEYIGIYPLGDDSMVSWGCSDIDVQDIDQARNIQTALHLKSVSTWVERTVKGYHVWMFMDKPTSAVLVRRAFLSAHQAVKVPAKEVNPKQEVSIGLGNYVRLPYPGAFFEAPNVRYVLDGSDNPMNINDFVEAAYSLRTTEGQIKPIADQWHEKQPRQFTPTGGQMPVEIAKLLLTPYAAKMMMDGPMDGSDRSGTLVRFAYRLRSDGLTSSQAFSLLKTADLRWGKFWSREDGDSHLAKIVADVYGE